MCKGICNYALDRIVSIEPFEDKSFVENTFFDPEHYFDNIIAVTSRLRNHSLCWIRQGWTFEACQITHLLFRDLFCNFASQILTLWNLYQHYSLTLP